MIEIIDISRHNTLDQVTNALNEVLVMGAMIKVTEGKTYEDPQWKKNLTEVKRVRKAYGFYHYARPENNTPEEEAVHFLSTLGKRVNGAVLALDWEGTALKYEADWVNRWIKTVANATGAIPMFYIQQSAISKYSTVSINNCGLWVARHNNRPGEVGTYIWTEKWTMHQYGIEKGIDRNVFNGTKTQFLKYAVDQEKTTECDCDCHSCGCCVEE